MSDEQDAANLTIAKFMVEVADYISGTFPYHANAIKGEIVGMQLTENRWLRIAAILASLYCLPGTSFSPEEHDVRSIALSSITTAQKMASSNFLNRDPKSCIEFALWRAEELTNNIKERKRNV
jgi:hypothetical protein